MAMTPRVPWLDRAIGYFAPSNQLRRTRARIANDLLIRHYEGAAAGRRTQGWHKSSADPNAATGRFAGKLRDQARDLVRNNPYAAAALNTIVDQAVGWGLVAKPVKGVTPNRRALEAWNAWANTTACDADGRHDFAGLQKLVVRSLGESGEILVRRRFRLPEDGLPIPIQLQLLEADFLDTGKHGITLPNGGRIVYGIEFDPIGRRVAYWLFPDHPGNSTWTTRPSVRLPAESILHVFKPERPGAQRGVTSFAPVILRMREFDEYEDATIMKQKIAACLAVITSDIDGSAAALGTASTEDPTIDELGPGAVLNVAPGRQVTVVNPPDVGEYKDFTKTSLKGQAAGLGVTYEDMTGDYEDFNFSSARMSRLRIYQRVEDTRWRTLVPQFCDPVWNWAMLAATVAGLGPAFPVRWSAPPMPMIEPDKEGLAYQRNIRASIMSLSEAIRERGYEPDELLAEIAEDNKKLDSLKIVSDSDPRAMTQAGQLQGAAAKPATPPPTRPVVEEDEDEERRARLWARR